MNNPIPVVVQESGDTGDAPQGSIPLALYGSSGGGASNEIRSSDGSVTATAQEDEIFRAAVTTANGEGILRILDVGGTLSCLLTNEDSNPLDSSWSPAGVVVHQDLDRKIPNAPSTGTFVLQSVDGVASWVAV